MKAISKEIIKSRGGFTEITLEELVSEVIKKGKPLVPDEVKISLMQQLQKHIGEP